MIDRVCSRGLATMLALGLAAPAPVVQAAPARDGILDRVSQLAQEGQTRFETADFAAAIDLWTQAYGVLPDEPKYSKRRNVLAYQIAQACLEAYTLDPKQLSYLRKAERLFDTYLATIDPKDRTTRTRVEGTLTELREKIRLAEEREAAAEAAAREEARVAAADAQARSDERTRDEAARQDTTPRRADPDRSRPLLIAGGVLLGSGGALLGVMGYGLAWGARVDRDGAKLKTDGVTDPQRYIELRADGYTANKLAIATAAIGGTLAIVGIGLLAAGAASRKRARNAVALAPSWQPGGAGLTLTGRF
jgi:hypothetical protein